MSACITKSPTGECTINFLVFTLFYSNSKKCTCSTLFVHFFAVVLHDYNMYKLPTAVVTQFKEEMSYVHVFLFTFLTVVVCIAGIERGSE